MDIFPASYMVINNHCWAIWREFKPIGAQESLGAGWGLLPTLRWVGSWLPIYLASFFRSSREKLSQWISNRQPLHSKMGTSPLSHGSLASSHTSYIVKLRLRKISFWHKIRWAYEVRLQILHWHSSSFRNVSRTNYSFC